MPCSQVRGRCGARGTSPGWADPQTCRFQPRQEFATAHFDGPQRHCSVAVVLGQVVVVTLKTTSRDAQFRSHRMQFVVRNIAHHVTPLAVTEPPVAFVDKNQWQAQPPPQPRGAGAGAGLAAAPPPTEANTESRRLASAPHAHGAGNDASLIGRRTSKAASHDGHRYSYKGMRQG